MKEIIITWDEPKKAPQETPTDYADYWENAILEQQDAWND